MARLNEPPVSTDNLDIIRRKLLRQNRDLARANSTHLLRIRTLEAQNAQLLSEKLTLEGRIITLENQPEDNEARRIADHAIDMRVQLEARLLQCVEMLGELGNEPPKKRHSNPREHRLSTNARISINRRSPAQRRIRPFETQEESEARAKAEGRLTPIAEKKDWSSRRTMDQSEIMALCNAADTTDSPELGPPPMSRFVDVDTDPVKTSPSRAQPTAKQLNMDVKFEAPASPISPAPMKTTTPVKSETAAKEPIISGKEETTISSPTAAKSHKAAEPTKTSSKRKFGSNDAVATATTASATTSGAPRPRSTIRSEGKNSKSLKELASIRREAKENLTAPITAVRRPLSSKSTNEDVTSPKKSTKPTMKDDLAKPEKANDVVRKGKAKPRPKDLETPDVVVPLAPPVLSKPTVDVLPSTESATIESALLSPRSPEPTPSNTLARDTPPPADISSRGETARAGRRARAAVSYAEPNLRDKMRRPTKELCDAVTGEGRARSRMSTSKSEEPASAGQVTVKHEPVSTDAWKHMAAAIPTTTEALERAGAASPLAKKASGSTDMLTREKAGGEKSAKRTSRKEADSNPSSPLGSPSTDSSVDPYEFTTSTPGADSKTATDETEKPANRRLSRSTRRLSSVVRDDFSYEGTETGANDKPTTSTRKRASMAHARTESKRMSDDSPDTSGSADLQDVPSRASMRRRSMML